MNQSRVLRPRDRSANPPQIAPAYKSTILRGPKQPLLAIPETAGDLVGPRFGADAVAGLGADLTRNAAVNGAPLGERVVVAGRLVDEFGRPVRDSLVEIWQANAAGRYVDRADRHDAPLDPNFLGAGRCLTDSDGCYSFLTIRPGAYPWRNHDNGWRPAHIHFSVFGPCFATRLTTQMYFPGDPLLDLDPIFNAVPENARGRLVARFALELARPEIALGFAFDLVLRGRDATPVENRP